MKPISPATLAYLLDVDPARHLGTQLGPYELDRVIGHGGMGAVYRANRVDGEFEQQVAVKLVGSRAADLPERLRTERQILAWLNHPNIARLLDGGAHPALGPYLVMEYVEGESIDRFAATRPLPARLEIFRTVCDAVQFSHSRLVVHCDLKPSNIRVTPAGRVKLLDFGVAALLDPTDDGGHHPTRLTPDFAAPEQKRGEPVSTASDVYALGRILERLVAPPPADLRAVIAKATAEEPADRYASAAQLSEDIGRVLTRRPVRARPRTPGYAARLFVARNRWYVVAAVLLAATLVGGILTTRHQARIAEARLDQVRTLANAIVSELHDGIRDLPGATVARRMLVESALRYLAELDRSDRPGIRLELADAYEQVAEIQGNPHYTNLGDLAGATASYRRALELREAVWARDTTRTDVRHALGRSLGFMAVVTSWNEDNPTAIQLARRALAYLAPDSHDAARVRAELGWYLIWEGEAEAGLRELDAASRALGRLASADPENTELRLDLWRAFSYAVDGLRFTGREAEALALVEERGLPLLEGMLSRNARLARLRYGLHVAYDYMGMLRLALEQPEAAVRAYEESESHARFLVDTDPANQKAHEALARAEVSRAGVLARLGRLDEAVVAYAAAAETRARLWEEDRANVSLGNMAGSGYRAWCRTLVEAGRFDEAVPACAAGVRVQRKVVALASGSPILAGNLGALLAWHGRALRGAGRAAEARAALDEARAVLEVIENAMDAYTFEVHPDEVRAELSALEPGR